jgi:hypothetical protein
MSDETQPKPVKRRKPPAGQPTSAPAAVPRMSAAPTLRQMALDEEAIERAEEAAAESAEAAAEAVQQTVDDAPAVRPPAARAQTPAEPEFDFPRTMRETIARVDAAWSAFRAAAGRFPSERMDERLGEGWTVKQMLAHVAAWHDLTADRVVKMINTGESVPLERDTDAFNAAIARQAVGKTSGEVLKDMDATFNRLRRQLARVSDAHLANDDWWLAYVVGGNTYGHYDEHWADLQTPDHAANARPRR